MQNCRGFLDSVKLHLLINWQYPFDWVCVSSFPTH